MSLLFSSGWSSVLVITEGFALLLDDVKPYYSVLIGMYHDSVFFCYITYDGNITVKYKMLHPPYVIVEFNWYIAKAVNSES